MRRNEQPGQFVIEAPEEELVEYVDEHHLGRGRMPLEHDLLHDLDGEAKPLEALAGRVADDVGPAQLLENGPEGDAVGITDEEAGARRRVSGRLGVDTAVGHGVVLVLGECRGGGCPDGEDQGHGYGTPPARGCCPDHASMVATGPGLGPTVRRVGGRMAGSFGAVREVAAICDPSGAVVGTASGHGSLWEVHT